MFWSLIFPNRAVIIPWQPPTDLPNLRGVGVIALDIETCDDGLRADRGSSWPWRGGYICGLSVAYRADGEIRAHYFPLRHPDSNNLDPASVFGWLKDLAASDVRIITQNGLYDWGWLRTEASISMPPSDRLEEIGAMAALIDENRYTYNLNDLCKWRGLPGKDTSLLEEKARALAPRRKKTINVAEYIHQLPAEFVGPYAEGDAASTLALYENLNPVLDHEGTRDAYRLECDLLPMVHDMRRRGIRIDQGAAEQARDLILGKRDLVFGELSELLDARLSMKEIKSRKWLVRTFDKYKIEYPRTEKGNASFAGGKNGWMVTHPHRLPQLIARASYLDDKATKFLQGHIIEHIINGRIHAEINPHRSDDGGTRSSRFSYSNPPLQQMPKRDAELAPLIRGVFLPEEGELWAEPDVSQQEFRFCLHYALQRNLPRAKEAAALYANPDADFHQLVADMTGLPRDHAKAVNFAKIYGAGPKKFAEMIGKSLAEANAIRERYDRELPFMRKLSKLCTADAERVGYTVLYDGARRHWNLFMAKARGAAPCSLEEALLRRKDPDHPWYRKQLYRCDTYTSLNALVQGSSARHTKLWMRSVYRAGILPLLQMHDALPCSVATREQAKLVARLGEEAVSLKVPMKVDLKFGRSWGDARHSWSEITPEHKRYKVNGTKLHVRATSIQAPIKIPQTAEDDFGERRIPLAALIDEPLIGGKIRCPFHDERTPSLHIYTDHFHCFGCGAHGDHIDWLMEVKGLDRKEARQVIAAWDGPVIRPARNADKDVAKLAYALRFWNSAKPIAGTLAAQYLAEHRKIDLTALPDTIGDALRFHPRCPFGSGNRQPCLIALLRDAVTDAPTGIHRIALAPDASKIERRMLGRGGVVKLWPAGAQLIVGEGIETVLAAATRLTYRGAPLRPAWSAVSSNGLDKFPIIPTVERLILLVDNDSNGIGQAAADTCALRYAGRVICLMPKRPGTDFNDMVSL